MTDATINVAINAEIKTVVAMLKESPFFVTGVTNLDGTHDKQPIDVSREIFDKVAVGILKECPNGSFMLIGVGPTKCSIFAVSKCTALQATEWLKASVGEKAHIEEISNMMAFSTVEAEYPIKQKDVIISTACSFLRKKGLLVEEEEDLNVWELAPLDSLE